ncbi:MAG: hypothetical protein N2111_11025 [Candidatus Sumerlaeaceae bacterium]|nr:hypothetical protein [Candidatus Sumerlaeaceae bacterium]
MNSYERTMARLRGERADSLPVHPLFMIYAADLVGARYDTYLRDSAVLVQGQMAVLEQFGVDLVSCCSDAWREAADCGARLVWHDHAPPSCEAPLLREPADLARLRMPDPFGGGRMTDRLEALRSFAGQVKGQCVILGWVEGPIALAANLMGLEAFLTVCVEDPEFACALMDWAVELAARFAAAQVAAGADMIGIGDAAASLVSPSWYAREIAPRERRLVAGIHAAGAKARLHICGGVRGKYAAMESTAADMIDIDYPQPLAEARAAMRPQTVLAGNLNPATVLLAGTPDDVARGFEQCHREAGDAYAVAPGCEVPPATPEANIRAMVAYARSVA